MKFTDKFKVTRGNIESINEHIINHGNCIKKDLFLTFIKDGDVKDAFKNAKEDCIFISDKYRTFNTFDECGFLNINIPIRLVEFVSSEIEDYFKNTRDEYIDLEIDIDNKIETNDMEIVKHPLEKFNTFNFVGGNSDSAFKRIKYLKSLDVNYSGKNTGFDFKIERGDTKGLFLVYLLYESLNIGITPISEDLTPGIIGSIQKDIEKRLIKISRTK